MEQYRLYHSEIPGFLAEIAQTPLMLRLQSVGMNCGCEYTSFPRFRNIGPYSRFDHSLGVAMIVWHFTEDPAQAAAGMLHDAATPAFAHVVDFLRGDYLKQESTEEGTEAMITGSPELAAVLKKHGIRITDVTDYHRYPIADNDPPGLSADRLEYTLSNSVNYGVFSGETARALYEDLAVGLNEKGKEELIFSSREAAECFAEASLRCSEIYVSDEDRYAMQMLSEILRRALELDVIGEKELYTTEPQVIAKLTAREETASLWRSFRAYGRLLRAATPGAVGEWRNISAKKRYIDPLVFGQGRVCAVSEEYAEKRNTFLSRSQNIWLCAAP